MPEPRPHPPDPPPNPSEGGRSPVRPDEFDEEVLPYPFISPLALRFIFGAAVALGTAYVFLEWRFQTEIRNAWAVSIFIGATGFLIQAIAHLFRYTKRNGLAFFLYLGQDQDPEASVEDYRDLVNTVFDTPRQILVAIPYAFLVGALPFALNLWPGYPYCVSHSPVSSFRQTS